jgi:DNA-binding transcriptional ArsR family regulator
MAKCPTRPGDGLDDVATALAHGGRRHVVARLARSPATSSELATELGVALPTLQRHLGVLDRAGLLDSRKRGRVVTHRLRPEPLRELDTWLRARTTFWDGQLDALDAAIAAPSDREDR